MSEARRRILERLRSVGRDRGEGIERPVDRHDWDREERIARFTARMQEVRAEVQVTTEARWSDDLVSLLKAKGVANLVYAPDTPVTARLESALQADGIEAVPYAREIETWKNDLFERMDAGFTGCSGAIAETGSLILWPDASEPRLLSLVPPIHVVLLQADAIYSTFAEAMHAQGWSQGMPTNALLISGPSKSADIAQVLAYGVHGPRSLLVLIVT